ncbi:MAG TPA: secretin N-terminal domain-containing protein [Nitrospiria bacterium]|nr:secretin N-terminal domain-containing protein [Nitrospiria bacterium]
MKFANLAFAVLLVMGVGQGRTALAALPAGTTPAAQWVTIDFTNVELPVFIKFISELIGKNFVIDEKVKGKVTIYSPAKISVQKAYRVFESVLELKGYRAVPSGEIIQIVPANESVPERNLYVYTLENAVAEDVAKLLGGLQSPRAPAGVTQRLSTTGARFEGPIQVTADKATNSIIINASQSDYDALTKVIQQLDMKRRQVYVEAVIMEVGLDHLKSVGMDLSALIGYSSSAYNLAVLGGVNQPPENLFNLVNLPAGITAQSYNIRAALTALQTMSDVNILSTPQLLASDNKEAEIVVGENVPIPSGQNQTTGGTITTNITRQDVGITLKLTPHIMEDDAVKLDLLQEITAVEQTVSQQVGNLAVGPTLTKRSATTTVIVNNSQTIVIGGLIRDNQNISSSKIPLLGDIPVLGWLFKTKTVEHVKTNLMIFLTPYVVKSQEELTALRERKQQESSRFLEREHVVGRGEYDPILTPGGTGPVVR